MTKSERKLTLPFIFLIMFSSFSALAAIPSAGGEIAVTLHVTRTVWGQDVNSPQEAYAGDTNVPLTVEVQNYSPNETIKGVTAVLVLKGSPFTDINGYSNATARGDPVVGDVLNPPDYILPRGFFTLTFSLDIGSNTFPGVYSCDMTVNYSVNSSKIYVDGKPQTITTSLTVSKAPSTISCSVSPTRIEKGETVDVSGAVDTAPKNATISLLYTKPDASTLNRTVQTTSDGSYRDSYQPVMQGTWSVNASWGGDERHRGDWVAASFEVMYPVALNILTSDTRLVGGLDNKLNVTLLNSGEVLLSSIDATFTITSPLVLQGDNHWTFKYLESKNSVIIPVGIYPPSSAIGTTYQGQLQLSYRDYYAQSHSVTYPLGLIIVGRIELVVYGKTVSPQTSSPGSGVSFTATVLNRGNVKAMYANASVLPSPVLELSDESTTYIGDIEENSPVPFTVLAKVSSDAEDGTYPIKIVIFYRDDQYRDHSLNLTLSLSVAKPQTGQNSSSSSWNLLTFLREVWWTIIVLFGASVAILILYRRRSSRRLPVSHPMSG